MAPLWHILERSSYAGLLAALAILLRIIPAYADSPGDLDRTFHGTGVVTTSLHNLDQGRDVAIQPDGKIILAGSTSNFTNDSYVLIRYNPDGSLDTTFGGTGVVTTSTSANTEEFYGVDLQPDGKIVAVGGSDVGSTPQFLAARYTITGALDFSFGGNGIVTTSLSADGSWATATAVQPDGKIVVAGFTGGELVPTTHCALVRYSPNGALDATFGSSGVITTSFDCMGFGLALQSDNKIVVVGTSNQDVAVLRYTATGQPDLAFNESGVVTTPVTANSDRGNAVAIQPDQKIIVAGEITTDNPANNDVVVLRYNPDGSLDTGFGETGVITIPLSSAGDAGNAVAIQPDGKIVVVGYGAYGTADNYAALLRYTGDGTLDTTFGNGGIITTTIYSGGSSAQSVALQPDGKLVVAGYTRDAAFDYDFFTVRYIGDRFIYLPALWKE